MAASRLYRHMALHLPGLALVVLIPVLGICLSRNDTVSIMAMYLTSRVWAIGVLVWGHQIISTTGSSLFKM
jgi:hypothetical protein